MTSIVVLGYLAALLGISGTLLLAERRISGWVVGIISNLLFLFYGYANGIGSFMIVQIVSTMGLLFGLEQWKIKKNNAKNNSRRKKTHR